MVSDRSTMGIVPTITTDTLLRVENPSNPHKAMSLGDFCKGVEDDSRIQCVLDCPSTDRAKPSFIKYVDDGMSTLGVLHMEYSDRHFIPIDMLNSSSWYLLHQPLYHTYAHHDADGYGTWTQVLSGHKFWTFIRHKGIKKDCPDRRVYFEAYDNYATAKFTDEGFYGRESDRFVVHAAAGDVIIQPPGTTHEVYTPTPSVTLGGHYLTYGSMHLTEVSRAYDFKTKKLLTNQEHVSIKPLLSMMVAALPSLPTSIHPRKSLFALLRMVRAPSHYQRKNLAEPDKEDETTQERRELSDVEYAKTLCISLQKDMKIKDTVWHYFPKIATQNRGDFIFDGSNWQDPGEDVEIPRALFGRVPQRVA
ncbi:hypothetical protein B0H34DRAFT_391196 [Crassisporium funariophilum]|nr:hypothetical protein B0H34DRAFT_391196 [Crassisporium funariophilum]